LNLRTHFLWTGAICCSGFFLHLPSIACASQGHTLYGVLHTEFQRVIHLTKKSLTTAFITAVQVQAEDDKKE
jgi:hypothetical protein